MITLKDIQNAKDRIEKSIYHTPLEKSVKLSDGKNVYLKAENQQKTKAYKVRGALNKMTSLSDEETKRGVAAISSGNHGAAVSYGSSILGIKDTSIFVPETTPESKLEKIKYYGAKITKIGKNYDQTHKLSLQRIKENNKTYIDGCSDREVIAGQGSIALEILEDNPSIDTILVPIGGGGLITGIGIAAKNLNPNIKVIGLQTEACPAMVVSMKENKFYGEYPLKYSICDALIGGVGYIPFQMANKCIDDILVIQEDYVRRAAKFLLYEEKMVVEPAGAIGVAAILENPQLFKNKNVAIVLTGGNIDKRLLTKIVNTRDEDLIAIFNK